jgi:hypothetical protein
MDDFRGHSASLVRSRQAPGVEIAARFSLRERKALWYLGKGGDNATAGVFHRWIHPTRRQPKVLWVQSCKGYFADQTGSILWGFSLTVD